MSYREGWFPIESGLHELSAEEREQSGMGTGWCLDPNCKETGPTHLHGRPLDECVGVEVDVPEIERLLNDVKPFSEDQAVRDAVQLLAAGWTLERLEAATRSARELREEMRS